MHGSGKRLRRRRTAEQRDELAASDEAVLIAQLEQVTKIA